MLQYQKRAARQIFVRCLTMCKHKNKKNICLLLTAVRSYFCDCYLCPVIFAIWALVILLGALVYNQDGVSLASRTRRLKWVSGGGRPRARGGRPRPGQRRRRHLRLRRRTNGGKLESEFTRGKPESRHYVCDGRPPKEQTYMVDMRDLSETSVLARSRSDDNE